MKTEILTGGRLSRAAEMIRSGGLVGVPTETVYGLAANGLDERAVKRIYEVKGRPAVKPLSLMVPGPEAMDAYCADVPRAARLLARRFWPGPLTIVLKAKDNIPSIVLAGGDTVGLRCPDHEMTLELLRLSELPLAAPSANPSGEASPKTARQVLDYFDGSIDAVLDGGECGLGRESTIIDMSRRPYRILRQGALADEAVGDALAEGLTLIGITGGSGAGKTTALSVLEGMGVSVIDCDRLYHELLLKDEELIGELDRRFPGTVRDGALDRAALAAQVFSDEGELLALNELTHGHISRELRRRLRELAMSGGTAAAIDAIELISSGLADMCAATVAVLAPEEERLRRIMLRDGIDRERAVQRLRAQRDDRYFRRHCGHVLYNDEGPEGFINKCEILFKELLNNGRDEKQTVL